MKDPAVIQARKDKLRQKLANLLKQPVDEEIAAPKRKRTFKPTKPRISLTARYMEVESKKTPKPQPPKKALGGKNNPPKKPSAPLKKPNLSASKKANNPPKSSIKKKAEASKAPRVVKIDLSVNQTKIISANPTPEPISNDGFGD